jgi:hypothetical protein
MKEKLLQFIWQFQYFNRHELKTEAGESLQIIKAGVLNANQGPDFLDACVQIDSLKLFGHIELHVKSSDWDKHKHSADKNYENIILHVVWEDDKQIANQKALPTLVLQSRVQKILLNRFDQLMQNTEVLHCKNLFPTFNTIEWISWKERLLIERLEIKSKKVLSFLQESKGSWEDVFWWMLASNFGIKVNAEAFEAIAKTISIQILAKHKNQIHQLEALLLGQANLLNEAFETSYPILLQREYQLLQKKYMLSKVNAAVHFLRMRPANFPTIRLAQLAMLIHQSAHLFSHIKEITSIEQAKKMFDVTANDYWHYHFVFNEETIYKPKHLGMEMVDNIFINTIVPILFAYGLQQKEQSYKDKALQWLMQIKPEKNKITRLELPKGMEMKNAFDTQAFLHLHHQYCENKNCLQCVVGNKILKSTN